MHHAFKRKLLVKYIPLFKLVLFVGIVLIVSFILVRKLSPMYQFVKQNNLTVSFFWNLLSRKENVLRTYHGRTNIVFLGMAGGAHEGYDLTDSIMFISIDFFKKDALIVSLPRDIWLPSLKDRLNTAYAYGQARKKGGGLTLAKASVEEVTGLPVHFAWLIDFSGFTKLIDLAGGVDINVSQTFEDNEYPIEGKENDECDGDPAFACRYEHLIFEKGLQHMDGVRALKFVRSRRAQGDEGTDFARGRRQQQVILALKEKILHSSFLKSPSNIQKLIKLIDDITTTDMNWAEIISMGKTYLLDAKNMPLRHVALDWGDPVKGKKGFLLNPPPWEYKDAWVLVPRTGNFDEIHDFITCQSESVICEMKP